MHPCFACRQDLEEYTIDYIHVMSYVKPKAYDLEECTKDFFRLMSYVDPKAIFKM